MHTFNSEMSSGINACNTEFSKAAVASIDSFTSSEQDENVLMMAILASQDFRSLLVLPGLRGIARNHQIFHCNSCSE